MAGERCHNGNPPSTPECQIGNFSNSTLTAPCGMDKKWLQDQVAARGHGAQVRLAAHLGLSTSVLNKLIKGTRKITAQEADRIREWLRRSPSSTAQDSEPRETMAPEPNVPLFVEAVRAPDAPLPPLRSEMPKNVPVYGTVVGGTGQGNLFDFELNGTIVDYARRPPRIAGRADVFAAYVSGGSMAPWREPGQLIYVEAVKPPRAMDYVLVEMKPHDGHSVRPALVKRLLAITPTKVRLRQFDPPKDFEIERRMVLRVLRVMDWDELMGV